MCRNANNDITCDECWGEGGDASWFSKQEDGGAFYDVCPQCLADPSMGTLMRWEKYEPELFERWKAKESRC